MLKASVRGVNGYPKRMYLTCNPGGIGHEWVKRLFVDREYREVEKAC
jgi:phage terminase large subunit